MAMAFKSNLGFEEFEASVTKELLLAVFIFMYF